MQPALIQTKLQRPLANNDLVGRPHLLRQLNVPRQRPLTLVIAPAGFGKTTLVTSWLDTQSAPYAWLSLDENDNDTAVFLTYLAAALQQLSPQAEQRLQQALQAPDLPPLTTLAALLIDDLVGIEQPVLLVLDDCHILHNTEILWLIERLLAQPHQLHLVLISRSDPFLPLPQLRLNHEVIEVRQSALRFSDREAGQFLQTAVGEQVTPETVRHLNQYVEGWIAGLRLAALSLPRVEQLTQNTVPQDAQGYITNYLFSEVLAKQPPAVQEFLLQTAVANRFCADLAHELVQFSSPESAADEILTYLQEANLFVTVLDPTRGWVRYHHLFQQMLQQQASAQLGADGMAQLHNRAGGWFARAGHVDEALHHLLKAENIGAAVALIEANSHNLLNTVERQRLESWLGLLPEERVWQRPRLLLAKAWLLYRHWQIAALAIVLDQLEHSVAQDYASLPPVERQFIGGQIHALRSATAYVLDENLTRSSSTAEQALAQLPESEQGALGTALGYWALSQQGLGAGRAAAVRLQQTLADPAPLGPAVAQLYLSLAFLHLSCGNLPALGEVAAQFTTLAEHSGQPAAPAWIRGLYHLERNDIAAAQTAFSITATEHYRTNFLAACDSWLALARLAQDAGDFTSAQAHLDAVRNEALRLGSHELLPQIAAVQAYQAQGLGDTDAALRWARAFDPATVKLGTLSSTPPVLLWARILAAHGTASEQAEAVQWLQRQVAASRARHHTQRTIQLLVHLALLQTASRANEAALESLQTAVRLGEQGGVLRPFAVSGPALLPLLGRLHAQGLNLPYLAQVLDACHGHTHSSQPLDPTLLTRRETEILHLMAADLSNSEIARHLVISLYTVKRHASNIYRKLGVHGRRQAVHRARQGGLLTAETPIFTPYLQPPTAK